MITNHQTRGRGQQGNTWVAEPGKNLTFSVVVKPTFLAIKDQFILNMAVSLGIRDFVQQKLKEKVLVKWPNDILVNDLKICGILIENQIQGSVYSNSIIGIGVNINQRGFYSKNATSISMMSNKQYSLQEMLEEVTMNLEKWYVVLKQNGKQRIAEAYFQSLYGLHESRSFRAGADQFEGIIQGVDDFGRLMIKTDAGVRHFNSKEVQFDFEPPK